MNPECKVTGARARQGGGEQLKKALLCVERRTVRITNNWNRKMLGGGVLTVSNCNRVV